MARGRPRNPASWGAWATIPGLALAAAACGPGQLVASLGDLPLRSGDVIRDCRIGYRTFGKLDATRSNAVLLVPWFLGRSADLARHVGPGRMIDSSRYFVVAVDAIGGGVSTSPSNSRSQPGEAFPGFTVSDLVESQHRLLTQELGITHLRAVVGTSLGGMQVFEWVTTHPGFMDQAVAIAGSPRLPEEERHRWLDQARAVRSGSIWWRAAAAVWRGRPLDVLRTLRDDPLDHARQAEATASTDVSAAFGGSMDRAASAVRARLLVVVAQRDEIVDPGPSIAFARLVGAQLLVLDGRCGHDAPACEKPTLWPVVDRFLVE